MKTLQRLVVMVLLGVWCFPATGLAEPLPTPSAEQGSRAPSAASPATAAAPTEGSDLAAREKQTQDLQDFKGGGVYIYLGGGAALVLAIILLILIV